MQDKKRIENQEILEYIYTEVPKIINSNPTFVRFFGSGLAKQKLIENVIKVYTNEDSKIRSGHYRRGEITVYSNNHSKKKREKKLRVKDVLKNRDLLETIVHECIHAILDRGEDKGSGILTYYRIKEDINRNGGERESGRGLNEGYTVWLCQKLGFKGHSYVKLTKIVHQIETAIGTDMTMLLGEGINDEFYKRLLMNNFKGHKLIALTDDIYWRDLQIKYLFELKDIIHKTNNIEEIISEFDRCGLDEYIERLKEMSKQSEMIQYVDEIICNMELRQDEDIWETEKLIFNQYFLDIYTLYKDSNGDIDIRMLAMLSDFKNNLNTKIEKIPPKEKNSAFAEFLGTPILLRKKVETFDSKRDDFRKRIQGPEKLIFIKKGPERRDGTKKKSIEIDGPYNIGMFEQR